MEFPAGLKYTEEHEWVKADKDIATIGITDFAQDQLGDIVFVELPKLGFEAKRSAELGVVESIKSVSSIYSPLSGPVIEVNDSLKNNAAVINKSPYIEGWIAKIKINDPREVDQLLSAEQYKQALSY